VHIASLGSIHAKRDGVDVGPLLMRSARQVVMTALLVLKEDVTDKMVLY
jgi:hypothetical protein